MTSASRRDQKWLQVCQFAAGIFSTCAKRQYFAIVIGLNGRVVGTGYNGGPPGVAHCTDGGCPRMEEGSASGSNYDNCIAIHAEANALLWSDRTDREGATLVINGTPCFGCAKQMAGAGIARLVYIEDPAYADWPRARALLEQAGVRCFAHELMSPSMTTPKQHAQDWAEDWGLKKVDQRDAEMRAACEEAERQDELDDDFSTWLQHGLARSWISDVACSTHDGVPMTEAEMDDVGWEGHDDDCVYVVRIFEDQINPH